MKIIGVMSGTSADGIDVVLCEINGVPPQLEAHIIQGVTVPYDPITRDRILLACQPQTSHVDDLCRLNFDLAEQFAQVILDWGADADLIASHGQTVWHDVAPDGRVTSTLQIGSSAVLAERTGITVIHNLRERDVAAGGQGAPLTAYVDYLLLRHPNKWRAVQNIGGMGNVSFLPPLSQPYDALISFDTGPGNVLIDATVKYLTAGRLTYDRDGEIAGSGHVYGAWLEELLDHPYFSRKPPKTTGRELFGSDMAFSLIEMANKYGLKQADIIATLTALTARTIVNAYQDFAPSPIEEVIVGGGGSRNPVLMAMIRELLQPVSVITHEAIGINSDYKEALVFAVLAYETWHNRPTTRPSQTGARHPSILGQITPGKNYESLIRATWSSSL